MKKVKLLSLSLALFIFTMGCSSDDDSNNPQTVEQMLMSGKWYLEKHDEIDVSPCQKKSIIHFFDGNKFERVDYYEGDDNCQIEDVVMGTFTLIGDVAIEVIHSDGYTDDYQIESISPSELVLRWWFTLTFDKTEG